MDQYLEHVQKIANGLGRIFMLDTGEGNVFDDEATGWYVEDLSGWLIEPAAKSQFLAARESGTHYKCFVDFYVLAKWNKSEGGSIDITFKPYKSFKY